jgi:hypothetical protein
MRRHSSQRARLTALAAVALLSFSTSGRAQNSSITTKLMGRIDSRRIAEGAPFFVKTISNWKEGRCSIPMGVTLEGRVAKVVKRGPGVKREEIDLRFLRLPCPSDDTQEVTPMLVAMHGPKKNSNDNMLAQEWMMSLFAATAGSHAAGAGSSSGGLPAPPGALGRNTGTLGKGGRSTVSSSEETIKAGEVQDFPTVKLSLPTLTSDPTVLTSTGELFFDDDARFIIVVRLAPSNGSKLEMARAASPSVSSRADGSSNRQSVPPAPAPLPALIENCVSGGCVTAPDATPVSAERAQTEVPLTDLAYRPRTRRTVRGGLEDDAAIAFLGDDQINPHPLVPRSEAQAIRSSSPRQMRGVLVSAADGRRLRVVDWLVPDQGAYLWPLDRGRVLVHVGPGRLWPQSRRRG